MSDLKVNMIKLDWKASWKNYDWKKSYKKRKAEFIENGAQNYFTKIFNTLIQKLQTID